MAADIVPRSDHRVFTGQMKKAIPELRIGSGDEVSVRQGIPVFNKDPHRVRRVRTVPLPFHIRFTQTDIAPEEHPGEKAVIVDRYIGTAL